MPEAGTVAPTSDLYAGVSAGVVLDVDGSALAVTPYAIGDGCPVDFVTPAGYKDAIHLSRDVVVTKPVSRDGSALPLATGQ
jgi:hypothetical protein